MTKQAAERRSNRRRLFAPVDLHATQSREDLVVLTRSGYAGVRLVGHVAMSEMGDRELVSLIALLRDARGVGLRVSWSGDCGAVEVGCLRHLDPPRQSDGTFAWSAQQGESLAVRRGPTFLAFEDTRYGERRRVDIARSEPAAAVLDEVRWGRTVTSAEAASLHALELHDLVFRSGDHCVGVAVRQGVWCV
ncbi:DUF5825 family protein [Streptomyces tropicalis]|uniref:DUF5825 family protein n=1 Tax=Streptomyces tropicalis TaxID=3034234 RepID=A0ABT6A1X5_9ACTN|nr:DUF5825 family protein [Streptomyces tropicalis]MDF3298386.1 DUF5825 family protein [Streptomyces tropicalis]